MQGLKVLVAVMGFAIFAIIGVIVVTVVGRLGADEDAPAGFGEILLPLPEDCVVAGVAPAGEGRLALTLDGPAETGCRMIVIFDLEAGQEFGRVVLPPTP